MAYATLEDLLARYGEEEIAQRSDRTGGHTVDEAVVAQALADAHAEADAWIGARYALPLPTVPVVLKRAVCSIARYHLWESQASERVRRDYEDALKLLRAIGEGRVALGLPASLPESARPQPLPAAARSGAPAVFDRAATEGY